LTAHLAFFRDYRGRADFERAICELPLEYAPRSRSVYSDLGFMLLGFILDDVGRGALDVQFGRVVEQGDLGELTYRPPQGWYARTAPTEVDPWRGRLLVGEVHDENGWALGGVAGHTGLFGTADAVGRFARILLRTWRGATTLVRPESLATFTARTGVPDSSRALGWDTMLPTSSCGSRMSAAAIGHTGYTGTSLWIDPVAGVYAVLLTNRVHPRRSNDAILAVRPAFHDAVMQAIS
jgi:CubicO group peptidase (beta-lactamase class C family)